jgi:hypothetical protein
MRIDFRLLSALVVGLPAAFVIVLSAMGVVQPAEGFCLENGYAGGGDPPSVQESAKSYFVSPELGYRSTAITKQFNWPVCIRSRRGEHRSLARERDRDLARLGEPNLSRLHQNEPRARVLRVLTHASFSPLAIAFRVESDAGGGVLHAAWQGDQTTARPRVDPRNVGASMEAQETWLNALPRQASTQRLSEADVRRLWLLAYRAMPRESVQRPARDGNWIVIEAIEGGKRDVGFVRLDGPSSSSERLLCAVAEESGIPSSALTQSLLRNPCRPPPPAPVTACDSACSREPKRSAL